MSTTKDAAMERRKRRVPRFRDFSEMDPDSLEAFCKALNARVVKVSRKHRSSAAIGKART